MSSTILPGDYLVSSYGEFVEINEIWVDHFAVTTSKGARSRVKKDLLGVLWTHFPKSEVLAQKKQGPGHYTETKFEPFHVILEWQKTWPTEIRFHLGSILKYLARLGRKDEVLMELKKIKHYAEESIRVLEAEKSK